MRSEIRKAPNSDHLRCSVGRVEANSPTGLSRQFYYEDIPHIIEALLDIYEHSMDIFLDSEAERLQKQLNRDLDSMERSASYSRSDWSGRLLEIRDKLEEKLPPK